MPYKDKEMHRKVVNNYYNNNKEKFQLKQRAKREEKKVWLNSIKAGLKCENCGYSKCLSALHFHHKDPTKKEFGISASIKDIPKEKILEEISKCVVLCANCHAEEHERIK